MHRKSAYLLFVAVLAVLVIGIVMLFSTSAFATHDSKGDVYFFVQRQGIWIAGGLVFCAIAALMDYHFWQRTWWIWFGLAIVLLALCFVPHIGAPKNGSRRWIGQVPFQLQPSELARLAAVFFLAWWFSRYEKASSHWLYGFVYPLLIVLPLVALIVGEVDLGTTVLIGVTAFIVMFVAGTNPFLGGVSLVSFGGILSIAMLIPERMARLNAFLHPEKFSEGAGLQQLSALIAFGSGGIEGLGLGNGREKMSYLPYAHTDFIFPMIGEELGLRVTLLVVFLFVVVVVCGMLIALHAKDRFGLLLACGIISLIGLQAAINIGVTTSLLPNKGLSLPFISYGGSNLMACLFSVGILLNIYRQGILEPLNKKRQSLQVRMTPRI